MMVPYTKQFILFKTYVCVRAYVWARAFDYTRPKRLVSDKHSSLWDMFVS